MKAADLLHNYFVDSNTWDEMYENNTIREQYRNVLEFMQQLTVEELERIGNIVQVFFDP